MIDEIALARTYDPRSYDDPAVQLRDYESVREYRHRHPEAGRTAVGNALGLPPSRVRGWLSGGQPDAVRGVETARQRGWLDGSRSDRTTAAFAELVVGVFACGSIDRRWTVAYAPTSPHVERRLWEYLTALGVEPTRRHDDSPERPTELLPSVDGSVFARCLFVAGAPRGGKNAATTPSHPAWLLDVDRETRRRAVELYVLERGTVHESNGTVVLRSRNRSSAYRESLAALCRSVTDHEVTVGANVVLSAAAARDLRPTGDDVSVVELLANGDGPATSSRRTEPGGSVRGG
ncbi:hypothetical protein [Halobellus rufus]|uniref:hypothetical protein n=1 Tax=Halobellus rufus TaxID=1448860 RepID=UPI0006786039|nr:hypothetical protein [Halobellus rufus]